MLHVLFVLSLVSGAVVDPNVESCLHINVNEYTITSELTTHIGECFTHSFIPLNENDTFHLTASYTYKVQALQAKHIITNKLYHTRHALLNDRNHQATTLQRYAKLLDNYVQHMYTAAQRLYEYSYTYISNLYQPSETYQDQINRFEPIVHSMKTIKDIFDNDTTTNKDIVDQYSIYLTKYHQAINMIDAWIDSNITYYAQLALAPITDGYACPTGHYCPNNVTTTPCPAGSFQDLENVSSPLFCIGCPVGYYQPTAGSSTCLNCSTGFQVNQTTCNPQNTSNWEEMIYKSPIWYAEYKNNVYEPILLF